MPYKDPEKARECKARHYQENREYYAEQNRAWRAAHLEENRIYQKRWLEEHPRDARQSKAYSLKAGHGLTLDEFDAMLARQGGVCAICRQPETRKMGGQAVHLSVDHNHETGQIRDLLCSACNTALGSLMEDPERVMALFDYIVRWESG